MKSLDECIAEIKRVDLHVEELEKLIKLLLVYNLIDEANCLENLDRNEIGQMLVDFLGEVESDIGELRKNLQESIEGGAEGEE